MKENVNTKKIRFIDKTAAVQKFVEKLSKIESYYCYLKVSIFDVMILSLYHPTKRPL